MTKTEKIWVGAIVAILVFATLAALVQFQGNKSRIENTQQKAFDPQHPNFVTGEVMNASAEKIEFRSAGVTYTAQINSQTIFTKQINDGKSVKLGQASIGDFKAGQLITVFFSKDPKNNTYQADKVQIIGQ